MNFHKKSNFLIGAILLGTSIFLSGCSFHEIKNDFLKKTGIANALHESPLSLQFAAPIAGQTNLYELQNDLFYGKPYNNLFQFGDNLLLVGEANYSAVLNTSDFSKEPLDSQPSTADNYEFSFALFSPWSNTYVGSLSHELTNCSDYQVCADRLLLLNTNTQTLSVYDTDLKNKGIYDMTELSEKTLLDFHASSSDKKYYLTGTDKKSVWCATLKKDSISLEPVTIDFYNTVLGPSSINGKHTILQGISKDTLASELFTWDGNAYRTLGKFNYFDGSISDQAVITRCDSSGNYWFYQSNEGDGSYFYLHDAQKAELLPNNQILFQFNNGYSQMSPGLVEYAIYDTDGMKLADFSYNIETGHSAPQYLGNNFAYFTDIDVAYFLVYNAECEPSILIWDLNKKGDTHDLTDADWEDEDSLLNNDADFGSNAADDLIFYSTLNDAKSARKDLQLKLNVSDNTSNLKAARKQADILESSYGMKITFGSEVPDSIGDYTVTADCKEENIQTALDRIDDIFSCYPSGFFSQLIFGSYQNIHTLIVGDLLGNNDETLSHASGFVTAMDDQIILVLNTSYLTDWDYTVNHEIAHLIDQRLAFYASANNDSLFSEEKWNTFNPSHFSYSNTYMGFDTEYDTTRNELLSNTSGESYFIDIYGTTYATEDRAEIFGTIMSDYMNDFSEDPLFLTGSPLQKKMNYYAACIRDGFNTNGWDDPLPWEIMNQ